MLAALSIRDVVLIEKLDLDWQPALCTLTGETGAGKSILLDALGLVTGARGDAGLVRTGNAQGSVTAIFSLAPRHPAQIILRDNDLLNGEEMADEIILRRVQMADGRSRAFCNDQPIGVSLLAEIGRTLVEIHGQNESQSLTDGRTQRHLLDSFGGLKDDVAKIGQLYKQYKDLAAQLNAHRSALTKAAEETAFLTHALEELRLLDPQIGEEQKLVDERDLLMNSEKIMSDLSAAESSFAGDTGIEAMLGAALRNLERVAKLANGQFDSAVQALERALIEAREAHASIVENTTKLTHDPTRQDYVEQRLFAMRDMARKHQIAPDGLADLAQELAQKLKAIEGGSEQLAELEQCLAVAQTRYIKAAQKLSKARAVAATQLDKKVNAELQPLKLDGGKFVTQIATRPADEGSAHGLDDVRFEVATNAGMKLAPIAKIASGGELARFMLALKVALAGSEHTATLIFDEVDAGVGGAVAEAVGVRLHRLAQNGQVLVVTHSPQVAARGDHQWKVEKSNRAGGVVGEVMPLDADARLEEVARMLSGAAITDEARAAARQLLEGGL